MMESLHWCEWGENSSRHVARCPQSPQSPVVNFILENKEVAAERPLVSCAEPVLGISDQTHFRESMES